MKTLPENPQTDWEAHAPLISIRNEQEYDAAVKRLNELLDEIGTNEKHPLYTLLDTLGTLVHAYEEEHYPIPEASGTDVLRFLMEEHGLTQSNLPEIGSQGVVSEILHGKRELNVRQIRALAVKIQRLGGSVCITEEKMTTISSRLYEGEKDFQTMIDLQNKIRPASHINDYPAKVDIEENLAVEEIRANTKLWFDDGRPIGWAYVDDFHNLRWELEQPYAQTVGAEMVAWGEDCIRKILTAGETSTLDASCREDYQERLDFIRQHGFHQTEVTSVHMKRNLSDPIPDTELPQGFQIRPVKGIEEAEAIASTHRAAFDSDYMTTENRLIIMNSSEYDPTLDLVVIAPDGMIAGYCTCSTDSSGEGQTDPVAVHPSHQRKGLSSALLIKGMQMLKERSMKSVHFTTSGDNISMQKSGESAGFFLESRTLWFEMEVKN